MGLQDPKSHCPRTGQSINAAPSLLMVRAVSGRASHDHSGPKPPPQIEPARGQLHP
jgi:hypothetical protein